MNQWVSHMNTGWFFFSITVLLPCGSSDVSSVSAEFAPQTFLLHTHTPWLKGPWLSRRALQREKIFELATNEDPVQRSVCPTVLLFRWGTL